MNNTRRIKAFIGAMMLAAAITAGYATFVSHTLHTYFALAVLVLAAVTSRMKVKLPGINGNMSVNLPFLLTAVVSLSAAEAVVIACVSTAVQCWPRKDAKFNPQQMVFNLSMMAFASSWRACYSMPRDWQRTQPGSGSGDSDLVPGTDRSSRGNRGSQRRQGGRADLVERCASGVPVLRGQRGSHHDGAGHEFAPGLGTRTRGVPSDVRDPSLVPLVFRTDRGNSASADDGARGWRGSVIEATYGSFKWLRSWRSHFFLSGSSRIVVLMMKKSALFFLKKFPHSYARPQAHCALYATTCNSLCFQWFSSQSLLNDSSAVCFTQARDRRSN